MPDIILHHYHTSPFSEKVRLILGYKRLAWQSVLIPQIMPKPDVVALTGGYRRTPFMQIEEVKTTAGRLRSLFPDWHFYQAAVPTYIGGSMTFAWGSTDAEYRKLALETNAQLVQYALKWHGTHTAW